MNPKRFKFHQVLQSLAVGRPFQIGFLIQVGDFAGSSMPAGATGANENIPAPTTDQKQH